MMEADPIVVDSAAWFEWLEAPSTRSFAFHGARGHCTVRREEQQGRRYWYAYRSQRGPIHNEYVGTSSALTLARLEQVAADLAPESPHSRLVGRAKEWGRLREWLRDGVGGRGSVVLVGGEAGIGKTTLADCLADQAVDLGAIVGVGRCEDLTHPTSYWPWLEAASGLPAGADRPSLLSLVSEPAAVSQLAVFAQICDRLTAVVGPDAARQQPLVLVLDDIHWADETSLNLLRYMARTMARLPLLILTTYRTDLASGNQPLVDMLSMPVPKTGAVHHLELGRLKDADVRELVRASYRLPQDEEDRLAAYLLQYAEGVPYYVRQLLRSLEEQEWLSETPRGWSLGHLGTFRIPPPVKGILNSRLNRLPPDIRARLSIAAIIGQEPSLALWAAVTGIGEEELYEAIDVGLEADLLRSTPDGATIRFSHALIREELYREVPPHRRWTWHIRIGERLESIAAPEPEIIARHASDIYQTAASPAGGNDRHLDAVRRSVRHRQCSRRPLRHW